MNKIKTTSILLIIQLCFCLSSVPDSFALTNSLSAISYHPATADDDWINTIGSEALAKHRWRVSTYFDYGYRALELTGPQGIVDNLLIQHVTGSVAPFSFWQIDLDVPIALVNKSRMVLPAGKLSNHIGIGDLFFRNRFTILRRDEQKVGFALIPFMTVPTGNEHNFVGDPKPTGGMVAAVDANLGKRVFVGLNLGAEGRERARIYDLDLQSRFLMSGGLGIKISEGVIVKADVRAATSFNAFFQKKVNSPVDANAGLLFALGDSGFRMDVSGGFPIVRGAALPLARAAIGLAYAGKPHTPAPPKEEAKLTEADLAIAQPIIYFAPFSSEITPDSAILLDAALVRILSRPNAKVGILGYTNPMRSVAESESLALRRAQNVADYLVGKGFDGTKIIIEAFCAEKVAKLKGSKEIEAHNRRVELKLYNY